MSIEKVKRILLVDDDDIYRTSEAELLRLEGYDTAEASGADQAKACLRQEVFHVALVDNRMPDEGAEFRSDAGLRLAQWMKQHYPLTTRIIVTTVQDVEYVKGALRAGWVDDYYSKDDIATGRIEGLVSIVKKALENRLVSVISASEYPHKVDPLHFWGDEGVVEKALEQSELGSVRFPMGVMQACIWPGSAILHIRKGQKVKGKAVSGGRVEVVSVDEAY